MKKTLRGREAAKEIKPSQARPRQIEHCIQLELIVSSPGIQWHGWTWTCYYHHENYIGIPSNSDEIKPETPREFTITMESTGIERNTRTYKDYIDYIVNIGEIHRISKNAKFE